MSITIDIDRLMARLERLGQIGALPGGGVKRLALSPEDAEGRALVMGWMRDLGLEATCDVIGNCWGIRAGEEDGPPVLMGSHIDTVATGGLYDGSLGVLAGLEVIEAQQIAADHGPPQVATVGRMRVSPDLVNVVPQEAVMTVDLRHTDEATLQKAEARLWAAAQHFARDAGCEITRRTLARFEPVEFDPALVDSVEAAAATRGLSHRRMPSGAGHDAQMFAPSCPSAMIFVPSKDGISHNIHEYTAPPEIAAGAQLLMDVVCQQAELHQD